jgi:hypothetical protein
MMKWKALLIAVVLLALLSGVVYAAYSYTARVGTTVNVVTFAPDAGLTATPETDDFDIVAGETSVIMVTVENVVSSNSLVSERLYALSNIPELLLKVKPSRRRLPWPNTRALKIGARVN